MWVGRLKEKREVWRGTLSISVSPVGVIIHIFPYVTYLLSFHISTYLHVGEILVLFHPSSLICSRIFPLTFDREAPSSCESKITKAKPKHTSTLAETRFLRAFHIKADGNIDPSLLSILSSLDTMTLLSDVITASARLHNPAQLSNDEYDHRIREVVEYFKQLLTTKALEPLASDESFLPVSKATLFMLNLGNGNAMLSQLTHMISSILIRL